MKSGIKHLKQPELVVPAAEIFRRMQVHPELKTEMEGDDRTGVRLRIKQRNQRIIVFTVGTFSGDREAVCTEFAQEKMDRLWDHHEHWTSAQSADKALERYKGAVRTSDYLRYLAASGLKQDHDELFALALARRLDWMTHERASWILKDLSENPFAHLLEELLHD